ncbi:MAG: response regulator [Bdellovibrionales bacterium]|nr:response regulator [Bdellovibrionales bacterium]
MFKLDSKVLVVDDMMTMRKLVKKACADIGFKDVTEAPDGAQAWQMLQTGNYDFVISDWNMPNLTGLELLKKVRGDAKLGKMPFILLTAEAELNQIKEAMTAGVSNYVVKPFTPDILRQKLEQTSQKHAA